MTAAELHLVHASKAYPYAEWGQQQFSVMHGDKPVGGISVQSMAGNTKRWWWEITTAAAHRPAMKLFRAAWDRLNAPGKFPTAPDSKTAP